MLKTGCVFNLDEIEKFYSSCGANSNVSNSSMFFYLSEDRSYYGMIRMDMAGDVCTLDDIVSVCENLQYDEFLLKSCVNFALTFNAKQIKTTRKYQQFLIPMHFQQVDDCLVGETCEIDFPHACCGGK